MLSRCRWNFPLNDFKRAHHALERAGHIVNDAVKEDFLFADLLHEPFVDQREFPSFLKHPLDLLEAAGEKPHEEKLGAFRAAGDRLEVKVRAVRRVFRPDAGAKFAFAAAGPKQFRIVEKVIEKREDHSRLEGRARRRAIPGRRFAASRAPAPMVKIRPAFLRSKRIPRQLRICGYGSGIHGGGSIASVSAWNAVSTDSPVFALVR